MVSDFYNASASTSSLLLLVACRRRSIRHSKRLASPPTKQFSRQDYQTPSVSRCEATSSPHEPRSFGRLSEPPNSRASVLGSDRVREGAWGFDLVRFDLPGDAFRLFGRLQVHPVISAQEEGPCLGIGTSGVEGCRRTSPSDPRKPKHTLVRAGVLHRCVLAWPRGHHPKNGSQRRQGRSQTVRRSGMDPRSGSRIFDHRSFGRVGSRRKNGLCAFCESSGKYGFCEANPGFPSPLQWATSYGRPSAVLRPSFGPWVQFACSVPRHSGQSKNRGHDRYTQGRSLGHDDSARRRGRHARRTTLFDVGSGSTEPKLSRAGSGMFGRSPLGVARATPTRRRVGPARKCFASRFTATSRGPLHLWGFLVYRAPRRPRSRIPVHFQTPRNGTSLEVACWRSISANLAPPRRKLP